VLTEACKIFLTEAHKKYLTVPHKKHLTEACKKHLDISTDYFQGSFPHMVQPLAR